MSFLSNHRLHWGAHDAITHHIPVQLGLIQHEEMPSSGLRTAIATASALFSDVVGDAPTLRELREAKPGLVDEPGP